ncbi:uncharacterized protein YPO0396 [Microbacterium marinum]|uniref:Uncharacterized protein YPO0396 n=1 Tax=Microbacterium marinum TaxID=421115 RepID=A0A7W7BQR0_9MICO|nr:hypothetical protein [Microbacterium marinum]MBB4667107.1 uncharacterized protein YPO0396 [Microbacterium marinum]
MRNSHDHLFPIPETLLQPRLAEAEYLTLQAATPDSIRRSVGAMTVAEYRDLDDRIEAEIKRLHELRETVIGFRTIAKGEVLR